VQLANIFQRAQCRWNNFEIILVVEIILKLIHCFISHVTTGGYMWNKTLKLFQNSFSSHVTTVSGYMWNKTLKLFQNSFRSPQFNQFHCSRMSWHQYKSVVSLTGTDRSHRPMLTIYLHSRG